MKHFNILLIFLISFFSAFSQKPNFYYRTNGLTTPADPNLFTTKSFKVPVYIDTLVASAAINTNQVLDSAGMIIYTLDIKGFWQRDIPPRKWTRISDSLVFNSSTFIVVSTSYGNFVSNKFASPTDSGTITSQNYIDWYNNIDSLRKNADSSGISARKNGIWYSQFNLGSSIDATAWHLLGDDVLPNSFIGSTNNASLRFRTNNTEKAVLDSIGRFTLNSSVDNQSKINAFSIQNNAGYRWFDISTGTTGTSSTLRLCPNNSGVDSNNFKITSTANQPALISSSGFQGLNTNFWAGVKMTTGQPTPNYLFMVSHDYSAPNQVFTVKGGNLRTGVYIGDTTAIPSAVLAINSTTQGFLPPRMTGVQMNAIPSPATGLVVFNTDSVALCFYSGVAWIKIGSSTGGVVSAWLTTGNSDTDPLTNFIGTIDAQPLVFKTNNSEVGRFGVSNFTAGVAPVGATGYGAIALGVGVEASGAGSFAANFESKAQGSVSSAMGEGTIAKSYGSLVIGKYNDTTDQSIDDSLVAFQIGGGTGNDNRSNIMTVTSRPGIGKVGIGVTTPLATLHVSSPDTNVVKFDDLTTGLSSDSQVVIRNGYLKKVAPFLSQNISNASLTSTGNYVQDWDSTNLFFTNVANAGISTNTFSIADRATSNGLFDIENGLYSFYSDNRQTLAYTSGNFALYTPNTANSSNLIRIAISGMNDTTKVSIGSNNFDSTLSVAGSIRVTGLKESADASDSMVVTNSDGGFGKRVIPSGGGSNYWTLSSDIITNNNASTVNVTNQNASTVALHVLQASGSTQDVASFGRSGFGDFAWLHSDGTFESNNLKQDGFTSNIVKANGSGVLVAADSTADYVTPYQLSQSSGIRIVITTTATASQTAFTFTSVPASYNDYDIYRNGVWQEHSLYTASGNIVTFGTGVSNGDKITYRRIY